MDGPMQPHDRRARLAAGSALALVGLAFSGAISAEGLGTLLADGGTGVDATTVAATDAGAGAPLLGPELDVDDPVLTGATGEQTAAHAVWDGKQFLAIWRSSLWKNELRAARLGPSGQVLDPRGVPVADLERADGQGAVAAGPQGFLLGWVEEPSG